MMYQAGFHIITLKSAFMLNETSRKCVLIARFQMMFKSSEFYVNFDIFKIFIHIQLIYDHSNTCQWLNKIVNLNFKTQDEKSILFKFMTSVLMHLSCVLHVFKIVDIMNNWCCFKFMQILKIETVQLKSKWIVFSFIRKNWLTILSWLNHMICDMFIKRTFLIMLYNDQWCQCEKRKNSLLSMLFFVFFIFNLTFIIFFIHLLIFNIFFYRFAIIIEKNWHFKELTASRKFIFKCECEKMCSFYVTVFLNCLLERILHNFHFVCNLNQICRWFRRWSDSLIFQKELVKRYFWSQSIFIWIDVNKKLNVWLNEHDWNKAKLIFQFFCQVESIVFLLILLCQNYQRLS